MSHGSARLTVHGQLLIVQRHQQGWRQAHIAAAMGVLFLGIVGYAQHAGYWRTDLPSRVLFDLVPRAQEFTHPR